MSTPTPGRRRLLGSAVGTVLAVGLLLSGCSSSGSSTADDQRPAPTGPNGTAGTNGTGRPGAATTAPARALDGTASPSASRSAEPTLPPGDPGADAPGTDDPNADATEPETPAAPAGRHPVPADAVVDAGTLGSITGSPWHAVAVPTGPCVAPRTAGALSLRSVALAGSAGRLVETVATYADARAANAAIAALGRRLAGCPGATPSDPRVGDASVQATVTSPDGTSMLITAVAAEGVTAVLSGRGTVADEASWPSVTDIALGNLCAAAADGCH